VLYDAGVCEVSVDGGLLVFAALAIVVAFFLGMRAAGAQQSPGYGPDPGGEGPGPPRGSPGWGTDPPRGNNVNELADWVRELWDQCVRPRDLVEHPQFRAAANALAESPYSNGDLLTYYRGTDVVSAMLVLEALTLRPADPDLCQPILDTINEWHPWTRFGAMRVLDAHVPPEQGIVGRLLLQADASWHPAPQLQYLEEFIEHRRDRGEQLGFGAGLGEASAERLQELETLLNQLRHENIQALVDQLAAWRGVRVDRTLLASIGVVRDASDHDAPDAVEHAAFRAKKEAIVAALTREATS
jgi:hypothetical protein